MSAGLPNLPNPVLVGVVGAAQGIRGEVRVKPHTADPGALADYGAVFGADGRRFEVLAVREAGNVIVVRFQGINDRSAAEALKGTELFVDRSSLPDEDLEEDEYFHADLEGLEAVDASGRSWGHVSAIFDFGGGDLLELRAEGRRAVVIPFSLAAVPEVDIAGGRILIDPEAAGLIDDGASPSDEDDPWPEKPSGGTGGNPQPGKGRKGKGPAR